MTREKIAQKQAREVSVYEAAQKIREILDATREAYGAEAFDDDDIESQIIELVTAEDEES